MDLEFTEEQEELRTSVRAFLEGECPIELVRRVVETGTPADDLWKAMVGLDWPALVVPEDCGGVGLGVVELAVVVEELGARIAPGPFAATATQFVPVVRELGTPEQRERFLGAVAGQGATGTLALSDHPRRWRVEDVTATAAPAGNGWVLQGHKHAVLADPSVDEVAVVARLTERNDTTRVAGAAGAGGTAETGGPSIGRGEAPGGAPTTNGIGVFVVPGAALDITPQHSLDQSRPLATIALDGVEVDADRALGEPGRSGPALERAMEEAVALLAVETVGTCSTMLDLVLAYAKDRHQFGVPIGSFQAVKHKMADLFVAVERGRALAYYAVAAIAEDAPERAMAVSMAKAAADDCQRRVCQDTIQTFGGIGFTWEHDAHLYVKRAKTTGALLGSGADHRQDVAARLGLGPRVVLS